MSILKTKHSNKTLSFLALFLFCLFATIGLYAQSKDKIERVKIKEVIPKTRQGVEIMADVFDEFGGYGESDNFIMEISSGGQPSPIDTSHSENYNILAGYVYSAGWPGITVTSPNGGERWCIGYRICITWYSSNLPDSVKIELSTDSGLTWDTVLTDSTSNDGKYCFTCPNLPSEHCRIRICDVLNRVPCDASDHDFTITSNRIPFVLSPNGGEGWCAGYEHPITWELGCFINRVNIEYSTNGGVEWYLVVSKTPNDGQHTWKIPNTPSSCCLVRVCDVHGSPCDVSDATFSIADSLACSPESSYVHGDANGDKVVDQRDILYLVNYLYKGGPPPIPLAAGDANRDSAIDQKDILYW